MENAIAEDSDASEKLSEAYLKIQQIGDDCIQNENPESYCPHTFDGWSCWKATPPGTTAYHKCPSFIVGFNPKRFAQKECMEDGTWFRHPISNAIWSNYTTCTNFEELEKRETFVTIQEVGYLISIVAIILALIIFNRFRQLQCTRVTIHKHLFVSFYFCNVFGLVWHRVFIKNPNILADTKMTVWCNIVDGLLQYFMIANYFWIFCEAFYLHYIIVFPLSRDMFKPLRIFIVFGWIYSAVPVVLYYSFSIMDDTQNIETQCIGIASNWKIFLHVPAAIVSIMSVLLIVNILRVLFQSGLFRGENSETNTILSGIIKSGRATLILIPILGLNVLLSILPNIASDSEIFHGVSGTFFGFQGLFATLLFCLLNQDVFDALRQKGLFGKSRVQPDAIVLS